MNDNFVHFNMVAYAHEKEGLRHQAEFYNFGWFTGAGDHHDEIISKTSCGFLSTRRHRRTGKVQHHWQDR